MKLTYYHKQTGITSLDSGVQFLLKKTRTMIGLNYQFVMCYHFKMSWTLDIRISNLIDHVHIVS